MKIVVLSNNTNPDIFIGKLADKGFQISKIEGNTNFYNINISDSIIFIDIDSMGDQGFTFASKMSGKSPGQNIMIAVSTIEVNSRDSKFELFFSSFTEASDNFQDITRKYNEVIESDQSKSL